jgi:hypothetical protein
LDRLSSTENEGKKTNKTKQQKKQAENEAKKNFKIQTLPSHTSSGDGAMG